MVVRPPLTTGRTVGGGCRCRRVGTVALHYRLPSRRGRVRAGLVRAAGPRRAALCLCRAASSLLRRCCTRLSSATIELRPSADGTSNEVRRTDYCVCSDYSVCYTLWRVTLNYWRQPGGSPGRRCPAERTPGARPRRESARGHAAGQEAALREALALSVEVTVSRVCPV